MTKEKFTVIYSFQVTNGREADFIKTWTELTRLIYRYAGSYGSRLHKNTNQLFIALAQWPDRETWQNANDNLPDSAKEIWKQMNEYCSKIRTEFELTTVCDLLQSNQYNDCQF